MSRFTVTFEGPCPAIGPDTNTFPGCRPVAVDFSAAEQAEPALATEDKYGRASVHKQEAEPQAMAAGDMWVQPVATGRHWHMFDGAKWLLFFADTETPPAVDGHIVVIMPFAMWRDSSERDAEYYEYHGTVWEKWDGPPELSYGRAYHRAMVEIAQIGGTT